MLKLNIKLALRSFKKDKSTFLINLIGLSTGLACAFLIGLWMNDEWNFDKFHEHDQHLYQVLENQIDNSTITTMPHTAGLLAEALLEEFPEIEYATEMTGTKESILSFKNNKLKGNKSFVGQNFFNVFSYELLEGDKNQVLTNKNSIVISESMADKFFNQKNSAIGQTLEWHDDENKVPFIITGIFKDTPFNSTHQFDFLLPLEWFKTNNPGDFDWGNRILSTYLKMKPQTDISDFDTKITNVLASKDEGTDSQLMLTKYSDNYLYGKYENGKQAGGRIEYVRLFFMISIFILLIACINFINLSTAKSNNRKKEIGIKKTIGAGRRTLVFQYLGESLVLTTLSFLIALIMIMVLLPSFNEITGKQIVLGFNWKLIASFIGVVLLTGLLSGSYPALYLSGFKPVDILRGKIKGSAGEFLIRKGLVVFQFALSILLIVGVFVVQKQIEFVQNKNLGYEKDNVIYFKPEGKVAEDSETFIAEMKNVPGVVNASCSNRSMVGKAQSTGAIAWPGKTEDINFEAVYATYDLIETLGIQMAEGRSFSKAYGDDSKNIILNEAAIRVMELDDPIGKKIQLWEPDNYLTIIGVVKDFHFESLHENIKPMFFEFDPDDDILFAKIAAGQAASTIPKLEAFYNKYNPGYTFDFKFLDESYQAQYISESRVAVLSRFFAGLAILISCLGLFGLAAFTAQRRMKEISIRKVLGASIFSIIRLLAADFTKMVLLAIFIGLPLSYFVANNWLDNFAFHTDLSVSVFVISGILVLIIAWITVGLQTFKAASVNPSNNLKE